MVDLAQNTHIKAISLIHFVLITWGAQGSWCPSSYLFYNILFMIALFWGIHQKETSEPVQIAFVIDVISIFFDVVLLASFFPTGFLSRERFSAAVAILNLIFRPFSAFGLYRICQDRDGVIASGGNFPGNFDIFGGTGGSQRSPYEDIDGSPARGATVGNSASMFPEAKTAPSYHG
ncbi:hypothetical protein J437_LFUL004860 [Ladona fulva]|uniref:Type-1 angiotensin II receptor-associated protein n=1 Tax=Ladona fulva TaxID=123851 RepID=A0A8K0K2W1_LADFU|nr:hypothetical protein J437_LFUL004860 [Ladona fulva]